MGRMRIEIRGLTDLLGTLGDPDLLEPALRAGLTRAAAIVQEGAQKRVHSPDNPYIGKAGRNVATGRLQSSIGIGPVEGSGFGLSIRVGHPHGKAGSPGGVFARSKRPGPRGGKLTGGRRNKGDPAIYGRIEEARHPFLGPSAEANAEGIGRALADAIGDALERRLAG